MLNKLFKKNKSEIRNDGYYYAKYEGSNSRGSFSIHFVLIFTYHDFVVYLQFESLSEWENVKNDESFENQMKQILEVSKHDFKFSPGSSDYKINGDLISMKFFDPEDSSNENLNDLKVFDEWYGKIVDNGFILSLDKASFNYAIQDYDKTTLIRELDFEFSKFEF